MNEPVNLPADTDIREILRRYETIGLTEMDRVKLMDRKDTKFIFREELLPEILLRLRDTYRVLVVENTFVSRYDSVYFDTQDHLFFQHHHQGKLNRMKLRFRKYVESGISFFEVKMKNNHGRTLKKRIRVEDLTEQISGQCLEFLHQYSDLSPAMLFPSLNICFDRITLVNKLLPERVTLDTNLSFRLNGSTERISRVVVAETKQERANTSFFVALMKEMHIRRGSLSKYCLGLSLMKPEIKHNQFNPRINRFKKLMYDNPSSGNG